MNEMGSTRSVVGIGTVEVRDCYACEATIHFSFVRDLPTGPGGAWVPYVGPDTWTDSSRRHFIDTGEYLPARQGCITCPELIEPDDTAAAHRMCGECAANAARVGWVHVGKPLPAWGCEATGSQHVPAHRITYRDEVSALWCVDCNRAFDSCRQNR